MGDHSENSLVERDTLIRRSLAIARISRARPSGCGWVGRKFREFERPGPPIRLQMEARHAKEITMFPGRARFLSRLLRRQDGFAECHGI
jgi:hypothetical protein